MPNPLYLPDWTVKHPEITEDGAYRVPATYDVAPEACLKCGVVGAFYKHGTKLIRYRDAPVHGKQTVIEVRRGRYRCRECGGTFMQPLPDMDDERRMTIRCREYIEAQCLLKPNTHVAEDVGIDEKIIRQIGRAQADPLCDAMEMARRVYQGGVGISKETRKALKKGRSIFLKRPYTLSPRQLLDLDGWLKNTPELAGAYEIKEAFMEIWKARTADEAKAKLDAWRESVPPQLYRLFKPVFTATRNWEPEIMNYFRHSGRRTNAATEARNRVIKMTNSMGAGYSFDMIRTRSLFGKRPGRVKAEAAARRAAMFECTSCKALFEPTGVNARHIKGTSKPIDNSLLLCADCHRFHTDTWFTHGSTSTSKSE